MRTFALFLSAARLAMSKKFDGFFLARSKCGRKKRNRRETG